MLPEFLRLPAIHHSLQLFHRRGLDVGKGSEVREQAFLCSWPDPGDAGELGRKVPFTPPRAMKRDREPVAFVADLLNDFEYG